jgi:N-acetylglucosamine-6-sulfatase
LTPGGEPDAALVGEFLGRSESLLAVDRMVERIIKALRASDELANTYLIFTSDNGYLLGEHGHIGKRLGYEESVRVPLVVRGPGIPQRKRVPELVQNIDLAPTVVDISGAEAGLEMDGRSLLPLLENAGGTAPSAFKHRNLLLEYLVKWEKFAGVRTPGGFVYIEYWDGTTELYDLDQDPWELRNPAGEPSYRRVQARLDARLDRLRACAGSDECQ